MSSEIKVGGMHWVKDRRDRWISDEDDVALATETAMLDEIERLRTAGDALAEVVDDWPELVDAWKEARRER